MSTEANTVAATETEVEATANDSTPANEVLLTDKKAIDAVKSALSGSRKIFPDLATAMESVQGIVAKVVEIAKHELPICAAGVGDLGTVESLEDERLAWATSGDYAVCVGYLGVKRPADKGGMAVRALVIFPAPTVDQYMDSTAGKDWLSKITGKETAHVAYRHLRNVDIDAGLDALYQTAARIPTSVDEFAEEQRSSGLDTSAFDAVWKHLRTEVIKAYPSLKDSLPAKGEVVNSIRSKSYAEAEYPDLEAAGVFPFLGDAAYQLADALTGADAVESEEIKAWLDERDSLKLPQKERKVLDSKLDFGAFNIAG